MENPIFESERIKFTRVSEALAPEYLKMINDRETQRLIDLPPITATLEDEINWAKDHLKNDNPIFSMIEKATGDFIGNIELKKVENGVEKVYRDEKNGKEATTIYKVLGYSEKYNVSLLEVKILTGRTHQIRVHLKEIGHPILGDPVYSKSTAQAIKYGSTGQCPGLET